MSYKTELQNNNTRLQNVLDKINALPSVSGGGGIDGGYSVTFVDEDGTTAAVFSVIAGRAINAPVSGAPYWTDETGVRVSFPYTPVADIVLDADAKTYANRLYRRFSVNPAEYPFIVARIYGSGYTVVALYFGKSITSEGGLSGGLLRADKEVFITLNRSNPEDLVSCLENDAGFTTETVTDTLYLNSNTSSYPNMFVNFNVSDYPSITYTGTVIDLNQ